MGLFPKLVGNIEVRQRRARYDGEPSHKRLSFVRPRETKKTTTESWEIITPSQPLSYQMAAPQFQNHPQWQHLTLEQRRFFLERYQQTGIPPRFNAPVQIHQQQHIPHQLPHHPHHQQPHVITPPHLRPQRQIEPVFEVIEPARPRPRRQRAPREDRGHDIFEVGSDTDSRSTSSTRTTYYHSSSGRSTNSSSSGRSSLRPVHGW